MDKYLNLLLDLPATINQKLPRNNFNEVMDGSENSVKGWVGLFTHHAVRSYPNWNRSFEWVC